MPGYRFPRFRSDEADTIWSGDRRAFLLEGGDGPLGVVDGICPHRGGPLALGTYDCRSQTLRCPWHGQRHPRRRLLERAWPALRVGNVWVVALPEGSGDVLCFRRRMPARTL